MGGAIIILTGEMGEPTYRLSCRLIPVGRLQGLFSGRYSCTENSLLTFGPVLWQVSHGKYTSLCVRRGRQALNGSMLPLVTAYMP